MNKTINKFLLAGDKFIHNIHLRQPVFTYSTCEPFTGNKDRIQKLKKTTRDWRCNHQNELDKACFQHDMTYRDFKDLPKRTFEKFKISFDFFNKNFTFLTDKSASGGAAKDYIMSNQALAKKPHKPIIKN